MPLVESGVASRASDFRSRRYRCCIGNTTETVSTSPPINTPNSSAPRMTTPSAASKRSRPKSIDTGVGFKAPSAAPPAKKAIASTLRIGRIISWIRLVKGGRQCKTSRGPLHRSLSSAAHQTRAEAAGKARSARPRATFSSIRIRQRRDQSSGGNGTTALTRSRNSLPGLKCGTCFPGKATASPVLGLRPVRGGR